MTDHPTTRPVDHPTGRPHRARSAQRRSTTRPGRKPTTTTQATTRPAPVDPDQPTTDRAAWLRFVPPTAALGTAYVLQIIAVTDTVGEALATTLTQSPAPLLAQHAWTGYLAALALGVSVASCVEGGAAYLMDLYEKTLLARESAWLLRLAMLLYVAGSAAAIHWWTQHRGLPSVISWILAGMTASALFLWSRGSRWRARIAMRAAGQIDDALPRLPAAAKILHPVRWLVTLYLVSWEPVATTTEARARYDAWKQRRASKRPTAPVLVGPASAQPTTVTVDPTISQDPAADQASATGNGQATNPDPTGPVDILDSPFHDDLCIHEPTTPKPTKPAPKKPTTKTQPKPTGRPMHIVHGPVAVTDAAMLRDRYGDDQSAPAFPGRNELLRRHGGNAGRWSNALKAHRDRADQRQQPAAPESGDDEERSA